MLLTAAKLIGKGKELFGWHISTRHGVGQKYYPNDKTEYTWWEFHLVKKR